MKSLRLCYKAATRVLQSANSVRMQAKEQRMKGVQSTELQENCGWFENKKGMAKTNLPHLLFYICVFATRLLCVDFLNQAVGVSPFVHHIEYETNVYTDATRKVAVEVDV